jgi:hypothetical protein
VTGVLGVLAGGSAVSTSFSITAGTDGTNIGYSNFTQIFGTINTPASGTLPSGKNIRRIADYASTGANFIVIGLSSDPGQNSLLDIISNGQTFAGNAANTYSYNTGTATWTWGAGNKFGFVNTTGYTGTILTPRGNPW